MAVSWSHDGSVQDQMDATVESGVQLARSRLSDGESATHREECGALIPDARREAIPGVRFCVRCQSELEKGQKSFELFNRRGNKDSQLK
jgi:phage/conjugal plasmid C-4 type zinc finger TraR family protein